MPDLRAALQKAGMLTERQARESDAQRQLDTETDMAPMLKRHRERERRLEILQEATSPDSFRREARKLLLSDPSLVQELLNIAHARGMQNKKDKGGRRLIANLFQVRSQLSVATSDEQRKAIVEKEFPNK